MKKIILCIALLLGFSTVFELEASAKLKDSPRSGYESFVQSTSVYYKPGGKKKDELKDGFNVSYPGTGFYPNSVKIIKFVNEKWVKVKYSTKAPGYQEVLVRKKTGYMKVKYLKANLNTTDYAIVNAKLLNLRSKPSVKSKVIQKIPLGTRLKYSVGNAFEYADHYVKRGWVKVKYFKKGKKYIGYVNYKYVQ